MSIGYQPEQTATVVYYYQTDRSYTQEDYAITYTSANCIFSTKEEKLEPANITDWKALERYHIGFVGRSISKNRQHIFKCPAHKDRMVNKRKNFIKRFK